MQVVLVTAQSGILVGMFRATFCTEPWKDNMLAIAERHLIRYCIVQLMHASFHDRAMTGC